VTARQTLRLVAVALFGAVILLPPVPATIVAAIGVGLLWWSLLRDESGFEPRLVRIGAAVLAVLLLLIGIVRDAIAYPDPAGMVPLVYGTGVLVLVVALVFGGSRSARFVIVGAIALFAWLSVGVMMTFGENQFGLDVYRSHEAAADAFRAGENPYTDAVSVADGSPNAQPGDVIEGYSYPPVTMMAYVAGDLLGGDPRWASVLATVVVVGLIGAAAWRSRPDLAAIVLVLLLAVPLHRAIIWSGWTEPVTLALVVGGLACWRREWVSAVLLGLALGSKQYMVLLVPLFFLAESRPWRRSVVAIGVAGLTLIPAAVADFSAFWFTMVTRPLSLGFRPDTRSISGLMSELGVGTLVPTWLMLLAVVGASIWVALRVRDRSDLLTGLALILSVAFLLSSAFTNYWWLVQWTVAAAVVASASPEFDVVTRTDVSPST
jgi:hypothetical protein